MNETDKTRADEIVRALRWIANETEFVFAKEQLCDAASLIESLQAQLAESQRMEQAARNELCLKCGLYHDAHNGACDGCRWKEKTKC